MIHLIWSPEEFLADELAARFVAKGEKEGEVVTLVCEAGDVPGLSEALFAPSLLADKRAVLVRDAEKLRTAGVEKLAEHLARDLDGDVCVVAVAERVPGPLKKAVGPEAKLHELPRPRRGELVAWVTKRFKAAGVTPAPQASAALVEAVGSNLRDLAQAVSQLATRTGKGGRVEASEVHVHFPGAGEQPVWALFDAIVGQDGPRALRTLHRLLDQGDDPIAILFALVSQVRYVIRARSAIERSGAMSDPDLARTLSVSPGRAAVLRKQAARLSWPWLTRVYELFAEADVELKGGEDGAALPPELVLERLVSGALRAFEIPA